MTNISLKIRRFVVESYLIIFALSLLGLVTSYGAYRQFGAVFMSAMVLGVFQAFLASLLAYFVYEDGKETAK